MCMYESNKEFFNDKSEIPFVYEGRFDPVDSESRFATLSADFDIEASVLS